MPEHASLPFRLLLSSDKVYRFQCLPNQQVKVVFEHVREFAGMTKHRLKITRTGQLLDGSESIGQVLVSGDILTTEIDSIEPRTIYLDELSDGLNLNLFHESNSDHLHDIDLQSPSHHVVEYDISTDDYEQGNDRDMDRWRKAHVSRIESTGTSMINISPIEIELNTRISHHDLMLHAALQLTENALLVQEGIRAIYFHLRSHQMASELAKETAQKILTLIRMTDRRPIFLHRGIDIVMQGHVDCGKWGALWRTKQRCWAVLWDAKMSFFSSSDCARKYMFALSNERRNDINDHSIGKRIQRDYAPHTEYNLSGWSVRPGAPQCERNTFALFDESGVLRQVLDVSSASETEAWVQAISQQAQQHLVRLKRKLAESSTEEYIEILRLGSEPTGPEYNPMKVRVPLKWLHVLLESQDANSRSRRLKCSNFSQAVKDIQRDVLRINGRLHASSCFEDMLSNLAIELMQHTSCQTKTSEMDAMAFARQLLIHSSRTHGGGDVLDAVHSLLQSPHFCICPEMSDVAPVDVEIQLIDGKTVVTIEMTMVFKLIPCGSESAIGRIVGTSQQRMICDMTTNFDVNGEIVMSIERK